jgi:hypothetical protein
MRQHAEKLFNAALAMVICRERKVIFSDQNIVYKRAEISGRPNLDKIAHTIQVHFEDCFPKTDLHGPLAGS